MELIYMISVNDLKELTPLSLNIEDKIIEGCIIDAQDVDLQPILGTDLYNKLKTDIKSASITGNYKTLLENFVVPCLIKYSLRRSLLYIWIKLKNKSVVQDNSDNSTPVDSETFDRLRTDTLNDAEFYSNRLKDYLCFNSSDFPEYSTNTNEDLSPNKSDSYFCGIELSNPNNLKNIEPWML